MALDKVLSVVIVVVRLVDSIWLSDSSIQVSGVA